MNKNIILIIGMILLLILSGCKGGSTTKSITDEDVRKGIDGLVIEFTKNAPPENVFEGTLFPIGINLKNKGAFDIGDKEGILTFGLETTYVGFVSQANKQIPLDEIKGKSIFNLNGDEDFITLNAETKNIGDQSEKQSSTILATTCYPYKTILGTSVCVDTDIFGTKLRDKACEVKDLEFSNGQGAPVAITKIETRMLPDADENKVKPHLIIHIENKGNGEVINPDEYKKACTKEALKHEDFNRIKINVKLSNEELDCSTGVEEKEFDVILREKKDIVRCTSEEGIDSSRDAYTSPLKIELDYGYTFTISKDIIIEKILTY